MESRSACPVDDILCFEEELLTRWEAAAARTPEPAPVEDCFPCLLADWNPDFDD